MLRKGASVTTSFTYSIGVRVTLKIRWRWFSTEVTRAGLTFYGSASSTATAAYSYSKSDVGRFVIPIYGIPGKISLKLTLRFSVKGSGTITLSATYKAKACFSTGMLWTKESDKTSQPFRSYDEAVKLVNVQINDNSSPAGLCRGHCANCFRQWRRQHCQCNRAWTSPCAEWE
ncbi:hypothetical protein LSAT2_019112 [Lamellibrachia satsuma]|nr:hypothetical protein LSAT2_019112 [Lamellibrachia satsuma]